MKPAKGDREILLGGTQLEIANGTADLDLTIDGDLDNDGAPDITVDAPGSSGLQHRIRRRCDPPRIDDPRRQH